MNAAREARLVKAHKAGRVYAAELFATAIQEALRQNAGDDEAQFTFLAGLFAELRRISAQKQNEGFRT
jgi:hypothetical protein